MKNQLFAMATMIAVMSLSAVSVLNAGPQVGYRGGERGGDFNREDYNRGNYNRQNINHPAAVGYGAGAHRGYNEGYQNANEQNAAAAGYYDPEQQNIDQEYYQETQPYQQAQPYQPQPQPYPQQNGYRYN